MTSILDAPIDEPQVEWPNNPTALTAHFCVTLPCGHTDWINREQWAGQAPIACPHRTCRYVTTVDLREQTPGAKDE